MATTTKNKELREAIEKVDVHQSSPAATGRFPWSYLVYGLIGLQALGMLVQFGENGSPGPGAIGILILLYFAREMRKHEKANESYPKPLMVKFSLYIAFSIIVGMMFMSQA